MLQHPVYNSKPMRVQTFAHHTALLCSSTEEHATDKSLAQDQWRQLAEMERTQICVFARSADMPEFLHAVQTFAFVQACNS